MKFLEVITMFILLSLCDLKVSAQVKFEFAGGCSLGYPDNPQTAMIKGAQSGWHVGLESCLGENLWYLRLGLELHKMAISTTRLFNPFEQHPTIYFLKIPTQAGLRVFRVDNFVVRVQAGGMTSYITSIQENDLGLNNNLMTDFQFGALVGAGLDFGPLAIDFNFEKGLSTLYKNTKYKADYCFLSLGFFF
jgi:hypothetical protein